ncbi:MAG: gliding motility-associated ABC transporter substrate-binding protein GldG [Bacteroidales bacterium]|nr:gliding motility-associated ABC transporter substrate-binding protein GldG [Bacteroidales bacterium]
MSLTKQKQNDVLQLSLSVIIVILIIYISQFVFFRIDLTSEKRYTLSPSTKEILRNLDDVVFIKVYLDGDLNIPFKKMQKSIKEILDDFRIYARDNIQYEFVNSFENTSSEEQQNILTDLYNKGLRPTNIHAKDREGGVSEKIIIPGALLTYNQTEVPLNLLKNNPSLSAEQNINNSIQSLEFEFINLIRTLSNKNTEKIAFIEGHGELDEFQTGDITKALSTYFQVDRGIINGKPGILDPYKAIIIAKPTLKFTEQDKFVIDQYIMNGGKALWFIDAVNVSLDSLVNGTTLALINELNIEDLLFRYGLRINPNLIQDVQCNVIPVNMAIAGNPPKFVPAPWLYYPLLGVNAGHPVTKNLELVKSEFASSIDTITARKFIRKTVLLQSSASTRIIEVPAMISLDEIKNKPKPEYFNVLDLPVAILLEGFFESAFINRGIEKYFDNNIPEIREKSMLNKMLVVADGDIIRNDIRKTAQGILISELGYDRYTQQTFSNKEFIVNAVNFLTDNQGIIQLRSREFRLRLLDKHKIQDDRLKWQLINTLGPVILILIFGIVLAVLRRRKYTGN